MNNTYYEKLGPTALAQVDLTEVTHPVDLCLVLESPVSPVWVVNRVIVPRGRRGSGVGTRLMREVLADADREGVTLALEVQPYESARRDDLVRWYEGLGFAWARRGVGMMVRRAAR